VCIADSEAASGCLPCQAKLRDAKGLPSDVSMKQHQQTAGMHATDRPQLSFEAEAVQHAEADMHAPAPCHTVSEVQLPPGLHIQPSLVFQAAANFQSIPEDCVTDNNESVLKMCIVTN